MSDYAARSRLRIELEYDDIATGTWHWWVLLGEHVLGFGWADSYHDAAVAAYGSYSEWVRRMVDDRDPTGEPDQVEPDQVEPGQIHGEEGHDHA
jgi:hypothetical protein